MTQTKKFALVLITFVLLPNLIVWTAPLLEKRINGFYANDYKSYALWLIFISAIAPFCITYLNFSSNKRSRAWSIASISLGVIMLLYFFIAYSLANISFF